MAGRWSRVITLAAEIFKRLNSKAICPVSGEPGHQIQRSQHRESSALITTEVPLFPRSAHMPVLAGAVRCTAPSRRVPGQHVSNAQPIWHLALHSEGWHQAGGATCPVLYGGFKAAQLLTCCLQGVQPHSRAESLDRCMAHSLKYLPFTLPSKCAEP